MREFNSIYVGLDTHQETISVALARPGREQAQYDGKVSNDAVSVRRLVKRLSAQAGVLNFCYEAGPMGYGLYRQIEAMGHSCAVVAPSLIPRKSGDRMKTDRRDAMNLARLHRAGELTAVWVPGQEQEGLRDLTRAREDIKLMQGA